MKVNMWAVRVLCCVFGLWFFALHIFMIEDGVLDTVMERFVLTALAGLIFFTLVVVIEDVK